MFCPVQQRYKAVGESTVFCFLEHIFKRNQIFLIEEKGCLFRGLVHINGREAPSFEPFISDMFS